MEEHSVKANLAHDLTEVQDVWQTFFLKPISGTQQRKLRFETWKITWLWYTMLRKKKHKTLVLLFKKLRDPPSKQWCQIFSFQSCWWKFDWIPTPTVENIVDCYLLSIQRKALSSHVLSNLFYTGRVPLSEKCLFFFFLAPRKLFTTGK